MVTKLTILERFLLQQIVDLGVPEKGSLVTWLVVKHLKEDLACSEDEIVEHEIKTDEAGQTTWKQGPPKQFDIGPVKLDMIRNGFKTLLTRLSQTEEITRDQFALCLKFGVNVEAILQELEASKEPEPEPVSEE